MSIVFENKGVTKEYSDMFPIHNGDSFFVL